MIRYFSILEVYKALTHRLLIMSKDTLKENAKQETFDLFPVKGKAIELQYSGEKISTDGGLLILKEVDNQINIIKEFTGCINDKRDSRYIATDNLDYRTRSIYEMGYSQRGAMELRIKEHKTYLKSDRTSCHKFEANQLRLFVHSVAYVFMHTMQKEVLKGTEFVNSTMKTLQLKVLKTAAKVKELKTKIKIEFPRTFALRYIQTTAFRIFETVRH